MLYDKIFNTIKQKSLIPEGSTVIAALSGGADSVCLTEVLYTLQDRLGFTLECAHVNHNLRGDESDGDEGYVRELCKKLGIPLHVKSVDVYAMAKGRSLEDAARQARYDFFDELSQKQNVIIATAHTLNDNAETFFINLLRGSGSRGLCAIPQKRQNIIRPLLFTKRDEIIAHLEAVGLDYRTDSTNADTVFLRNFLRHNVIPQFEARDGVDIYNAIMRATENLQKESEALDIWASSVNELSVDTLCTLPDAVLFRVLSNAIEKEHCTALTHVMFEKIKLLLKRPSAKQQLCGTLFAKNRGGKIEFINRAPKSSAEVCLSDGQNELEDKIILIKNTKEIYNTLTKATLNCDKITNTLIARTRRDGDKFVSAKRKCTTNLKKLLINDKVPQEKRDRLTVIADGENLVFVEGYGVSAHYKATADDKNTICIEIKEKKQC